MSTVHYGGGRRTNIDESLSDDELRNRIGELRGYDRLSRQQSDDLRDLEHHLMERERGQQRARLERQLGLPAGSFARAEESGTRVTAEGVTLNPNAIERVRDTSLPAEPAPVRRGREQHAEARRILQRSRLLSEESQDLVARTLEADPTPLTAQLVAATSSEHYARAFAKVAADPTNGHRSFTTEEGYAWRRADEMRAITTVTGDALIPTHLDPSVMLSSAGAIDPLRQIARVVQLTVGGTWHGVSSAGVSARWAAEGSEATDNTPTFDAPEVPTHKADAWIEATVEAVQDAASFQAELGMILADAKVNHEAPAFVTGTGVDQPTGVISGLAAGETVTTAGVDAFDDADVYALLEALPPRFRQNATWLANLGILNAIDQMETTNGAKKFPELGNERLLRKPIREHSEVSENVATGQHIMVVGDFRHYLIADRLGAAVEFVPHLMGANRRPTGTRGFWYRWRVGGAPVVANAFRRLAVQ